MSVGRSWRTPAKHGLMNDIVGREVGAANSIDKITRLRWDDLTAGDGVVSDDLVWRENCSPGILAHHGRKAKKPLRITLFEIKPATYDRLLSNLSEQLPRLGYERANGGWCYGGLVELRSVLGNGAEVRLDGIRRSDAVLVSNDPNAITDWAMRPGFPAEVDGRTPWFRNVSTMGCNPAGLKRLDRQTREGWFPLLADQEASLPRHRDLLLAAIRRDDAQWAYLLCEPVKWRERVEREVANEFRRHGKDVDLAWFRTQRDHYEDVKLRLFLTKTEREDPR